ncbi:hypothetical protein A9L43_22255 [Pseudomonas mosselii]|uniref:phage tail assembly chaperone n=1 Tax=Pseudomonas mosselii TaxID=78327 RepID=UPI00083E4FC9|nr:phage tail assembly chaperone [Pseudomonas mosselii]ODB37740.1 hypothetical protein A9L43_22255 [Pseudomonas mosselii]
MKYYRDAVTNEVFAFEADGSQDSFIGDDLVLMSDEDVEAHLNPPTAVKSREQIEAAEREWRDAAVTAVLWLRERHRDEKDLQRSTTLTSAQFAELLNYLQALRDWPQSEAFPASQFRPESPSWVADQAR